MNCTVHTRLHQAIVDDNLIEVETLMAPGDIDVNVVGEYEKGALHIAAEIGNLEVVRVLLAYNPTVGNLRGVDINAADIIGSTALHYAVEKGHEPVVRVLLDRAEINPNAIAEHNDSKTPLHIAAEKGHLEVVLMLLACNPTVENLRGVDVNAADIIGSTALHYAVEKGHEPVVRVLLDRAEINPNAIAEHNDSKTPLHVAAEVGNLEVVWALLAYRRTVGNLRVVDVNAANITGMTALHYAVEKGHEPVVRVLLDRAEINPNAIAEHEDSKTPLHIAAEKGKSEIVHALLSSRHTIQVNARDSRGSTALHYAAIGENERVVEELLSYCRVHSLDNAPKNQRRASPLHLAALFGRHKIVSKLITAGLPVNKTALSRHTPLHFAVHSGSSQTVRVLLKEGEDMKVSEADWRGLTPVEYARQACETNRNGFRPECLPRQKSPREDAQIMMHMLERFDKEGLQKERQSCIDCANAILVGAALIASIAFASWLQPPLGFQPAYSSQFLELNPAAPPNTYQPFVYFHSNPMKAFWILNGLSFFFAIGSFLLGADVSFPTRYTWQRVDMDSMRLAINRASIFLLVAVVFIVGAFICAGFTDLPSTSQDWAYMIATAVVGGFPCMLGMKQYALKIRDALEDRSVD